MKEIYYQEYQNNEDEEGNDSEDEENRELNGNNPYLETPLNN
jgi:hypothetical protein